MAQRSSSVHDDGLRSTLTFAPQRAEQDPSYRLLAKYLLHFPWAVLRVKLNGTVASFIE